MPGRFFQNTVTGLKLQNSPTGTGAKRHAHIDLVCLKCAKTSIEIEIARYNCELSSEESMVDVH